MDVHCAVPLVNVQVGKSNVQLTVSHWVHRVPRKRSSGLYSLFDVFVPDRNPLKDRVLPETCLPANKDAC